MYPAAGATDTTQPGPPREPELTAARMSAAKQEDRTGQHSNGEIDVAQQEHLQRESSMPLMYVMTKVTRLGPLTTQQRSNALNELVFEPISGPVCT